MSKVENWAVAKVYSREQSRTKREGIADVGRAAISVVEGWIGCRVGWLCSSGSEWR